MPWPAVSGPGLRAEILKSESFDDAATGLQPLSVNCQQGSCRSRGRCRPSTSGYGLVPDDTIAWDLATFRALLGATGYDGIVRANALPDSVVGPEAWLGMMRLYDDFVTQYPEFASQDMLVTGPNGFAQSMRIWRSDLIRYAEEIRAELRAYRDGTRATVFSNLIDGARGGDRLKDILRRSFGDPMDILWNCLNEVSLDCDRLESIRSSASVREALTVNEEFRRLARHSAIAGSYLRHWVALALRDAVGRGSGVTSIAAGWVAIPDMDQIVRTVEVGLDSWPELIREIDRGMEGVEAVLRSDEIGRELARPFEHAVLTGLEFASLGDIPLAELQPW